MDDLSKINKKIPDGLDEVGRPYKALIVDDDNTTRKIITQILRSDGYKIVGEAVDGEMAVEMYKEIDPDIVTMDMNMPKMDGFEALKQIKQFDVQAVVVMLTSVSNKENILKIIETGAKNYILKPIQRDNVLKSIKKILPARAKIR